MMVCNTIWCDDYTKSNFFAKSKCRKGRLHCKNCTKRKAWNRFVKRMKGREPLIKYAFMSEINFIKEELNG